MLLLVQVCKLHFVSFEYAKKAEPTLWLNWTSAADAKKVLKRFLLSFSCLVFLASSIVHFLQFFDPSSCKHTRELFVPSIGAGDFARIGKNEIKMKKLCKFHLQQESKSSKMLPPLHPQISVDRELVPLWNKICLQSS